MALVVRSPSGELLLRFDGSIVISCEQIPDNGFSTHAVRGESTGPDLRIVEFGEDGEPDAS